MNKLTPKQQRFVEEYLIDLNATQAAVRAGYSAKNAHKIGSELLGKTSISEAIQKAISKRSERVQLDSDWVLERLKENVDRCMQAIPVYDREGNETGEYKWEPNAANKSLELIGKHLGMFKEKIEATIEHEGSVTHMHKADLSNLSVEELKQLAGILAKTASDAR